MHTLVCVMPQFGSFRRILGFHKVSSSLVWLLSRCSTNLNTNLLGVNVSCINKYCCARHNTPITYLSYHTKKVVGTDTMSMETFYNSFLKNIVQKSLFMVSVLRYLFVPCKYISHTCVILHHRSLTLILLDLAIASYPSYHHHVRPVVPSASLCTLYITLHIIPAYNLPYITYIIYFYCTIQYLITHWKNI